MEKRCDEFLPAIDDLVLSAQKAVANDSYDFSNRLSSYELYGVDNEFDLIEALYDEWSESNPYLLKAPFFVERRIRCAMNPEYIEKCLQSRAFHDIRDKILMCGLGDLHE